MKWNVFPLLSSAWRGISLHVEVHSRTDLDHIRLSQVRLKVICILLCVCCVTLYAIRLICTILAYFSTFHVHRLYSHQGGTL
jgi:hypothetical protein